MSLKDGSQVTSGIKRQESRNSEGVAYRGATPGEVAAHDGWRYRERSPGEAAGLNPRALGGLYFEEERKLKEVHDRLKRGHDGKMLKSLSGVYPGEKGVSKPYGY